MPFTSKRSQLLFPTALFPAATAGQPSPRGPSNPSTLACVDVVWHDSHDPPLAAPDSAPCDLLAFLTAVSWACVPCPVHVHVLLRRSCDERCGEQTQRTCLLAVLQTTAPRGQDGLALCLPGRGALHVHV